MSKVYYDLNLYWASLDKPKDNVLNNTEAKIKRPLSLSSKNDLKYRLSFTVGSITSLDTMEQGYQASLNLVNASTALAESIENVMTLYLSDNNIGVLAMIWEFVNPAKIEDSFRMYVTPVTISYDKSSYTNTTMVIAGVSPLNTNRVTKSKTFLANTTYYDALNFYLGDTYVISNNFKNYKFKKSFHFTVKNLQNYGSIISAFNAQLKLDTQVIDDKKKVTKAGKTINTALVKWSVIKLIIDQDPEVLETDDQVIVIQPDDMMGGVKYSGQAAIFTTAFNTSFFNYRYYKLSTRYYSYNLTAQAQAQVENQVYELLAIQGTLNNMEEVSTMELTMSGKFKQ